MKTSPAVDITATLIILAAIILGGWWWLDHKTNQIEQQLKTKPASEVRKGLITKAELTIFERVANTKGDVK